MSNQHKPWSDEEKKLLAELVAKADTGTTGRIKSREMRKIEVFFPTRSRQAVFIEIHRQRNNGGIERRAYNPWTEDEEVLLRSLYSGDKWRLNLKKHFPDREPRDVLEKAHTLGIQRRILKTEARQLNDGQKGVMAGLIMGDGCLNHRIAGQRNNQHINTIEFSNTDVGLVELFASMVTNCNVNSYQPKRGPWITQKRIHYSATVAAREAVENILIQILPYLAGEKLNQAKEMLICLRGGHA